MSSTPWSSTIAASAPRSARAIIEIVRRYGRLRFLPGQDRDAILRCLPGQDRAIVSEPFANKHDVRAGDRLTLPLGDRNVTLTVAGIYYDYSSSQGYVILDRSTLLQYLPDQPATNVAVYLAPGRRPRSACSARSSCAPRRYGVAVAPNQTLRRNAIVIFDRTFAITWALEAVAIVVAMLGAANSLLALVLDRRRELGLLRYLGASPAQIRRMILTEAAFLGLAGAPARIGAGLRSFATIDIRSQQAELRLDHPVSSPRRRCWRRAAAGLVRHRAGRTLPGAGRRAPEPDRRDS